MFKNVILVAVGGAVGSVARYLLSRWVQSLSMTTFAGIGTMAANILGCFIIGMVSAAAEAKGIISQDVKLVLTVGFCGGFTTFSTFMNESLAMMNHGQILSMAVYIGMSVALGLMAVAAGMYVTKMLL